MELMGEVVIDAPRERVWAALNDGAMLQACIPGCEEVVDESDTVRRVRVMLKLGPVRARFQGRVSLSEVEPPQRCVLSFEGSGGAAGMASGRSQVELFEQSDGTRLSYTVNASVGGKLGQVGGRMIDASAKQLADQFFTALAGRLGAVPQPAEGAAPPTPAGQAAPQQPLVPALTAMPAPAPAPTYLPIQGEVSRLLWFLMGVAATGFGVWLGANLF